jgi:hypothetical protein
MKPQSWETANTYGLAAVGAAAGAFKYYVRPELTAKRAWIGIGLGVLAYEVAAPEGELLSEGVDRALERSKLWALPVGYVALHLINLLPQRADGLHLITVAARNLVR